MSDPTTNQIPESNALQPLNIFLTKADRVGEDLSAMSNFLDGYIQHLAVSVQHNAGLEAVRELPVADIGIINELVHQAHVVVKGNVMLLPDFDRLPRDIKRKLKEGVYTIGESRQVEDNLRAVILDENGVRVKDITLKKVITNPGTMETVRNLEQQIQMRQALDKLSEVQELQRFQIEKDRDRDIFSPFLLARKYVLRAELQATPEERRALLAKADEEMTKAIHAVMLDFNTTARSLANAAAKPYTNVAHTLDAYMNYMARDMQALNQFVGIELQILAHLDKPLEAQLVIDEYQHTLDFFLNTPLGKKGLPAADIMHNYFNYDEANMNCWYRYATEMRPVLAQNMDALRLQSGQNMMDVYVMDVEDSAGGTEE